MYVLKFATQFPWQCYVNKRCNVYWVEQNNKKIFIVLYKCGYILYAPSQNHKLLLFDMQHLSYGINFLTLSLFHVPHCSLYTYAWILSSTYHGRFLSHLKIYIFSKSFLFPDWSHGIVTVCREVFGNGNISQCGKFSKFSHSCYRGTEITTHSNPAKRTAFGLE